VRDRELSALLRYIYKFSGNATAVSSKAVDPNLHRDHAYTKNRGEAKGYFLTIKKWVGVP
jgi:hypothetical protein